MKFTASLYHPNDEEKIYNKDAPCYININNTSTSDIPHMVPLNYQIWHLYEHLTVSSYDVQDEWKTFRNFLKVQSSKQVKPSGKIATEHHDLAETFPNLSMIVKDYFSMPTRYTLCRVQF